MRLKKLEICLSIFVVMVALALPGCQGSDKSDETEIANQVEPKNYEVDATATDSISALELLQKNHEVRLHMSLMGAFVSGIDGVENTSAGYWVYKVNDTTPKIACDKMILLPGDRLKWLFQLSDESEPAKTE